VFAQHIIVFAQHIIVFAQHIIVFALSSGADTQVCPHCPDELGEHTGSPLRAVVQWFKTMTTNEYIRGVKTLGWQRFNEKLWQRNYWEHIIRNNHSYQSIVNYIINNPMNWTKDKFYTE
jgi:hypothetical protein